MRASVLLTASVIASITCLPSLADAQIRVARPRPAVPARSVVVSRPTVFVGGYYFPTLYRASLWYDPWYSGYYGFYGPAY